MDVGAWVEVECAVCGGRDAELLCAAEEVCADLEALRRFHRRRLRTGDEAALAERAEFTQDYCTAIVACAGCGLVFRNPRPPAEAIVRAYAQDRYGPERLSALFEAQLELHRPKARALRRWLSPEGGKPVRVLEVGSFVGGFLAAGAEQGWEVLGIDPGEEVAAFCAARGLPVLRTTLPELTPGNLPPGWAPGAVDAVAIWNAFDQLPDPEPTLAAARRLLRPGGLFLLRVPNGACFRAARRALSRLPRPLRPGLRALLAWNNLLAFPYLHGYSLRTLDWLLSWHDFVRIERRADTLCRLADATTRRWAAWEERLLKGLAGAIARLDSLRPNSPLALAPWLDAVYRLCPVETEARRRCVSATPAAASAR